MECRLRPDEDCKIGFTCCVYRLAHLRTRRPQTFHGPLGGEVVVCGMWHLATAGPVSSAAGSAQPEGSHSSALAILHATVRCQWRSRGGYYPAMMSSGERHLVGSCGANHWLVRVTVRVMVSVWAPSSRFYAVAGAVTDAVADTGGPTVLGRAWRSVRRVERRIDSPSCCASGCGGRSRTSAPELRRPFGAPGVGGAVQLKPVAKQPLEVRSVSLNMPPRAHPGFRQPLQADGPRSCTDSN